MLLRKNAVLWVAGAALLALPAAGQQRQLTARELFYAPKTAPAKATEKPKPTEQPKVARARRNETKTVAKAKKAPPPVTSKPAETVEPATTATTTSGPSQIEAQIVPAVSTVSVSEFPLGLRYSLLKESSDRRYEEVDPDTVFRSGDRIRLTVEANDSAYLYVVAKGSSGAWRVLFPSEEIAQGDNRIIPNRRYDLPPGGRWTFYNQPGEEKLFIVLSRQPENDLEGLIYSLSSGRPTTKPTSQPAAPAQPKQIMLAQNMINDDLVQRIRNEMAARDLVFEKVDESTPGERKEKAVYVVNPNRDPEARLVVDLSLKHQ